MKERVSILDKYSCEIDTCMGPSPDGSCPRAGNGSIVPCAGRYLLFAGSYDRGVPRPYVVPPLTTYCPFTLAASLAVSSDFDQYET